MLAGCLDTRGPEGTLGFQRFTGGPRDHLEAQSLQTSLNSQEEYPSFQRT